MDIAIVNGLSHPVHVAVVRTGPLSLQCIVSSVPVIAAREKLLRREELRPGETLSIAGLDERTRPVTMSRRDIDGNLVLQVRSGTRKTTGERHIRITILAAG